MSTKYWMHPLSSRFFGANGIQCVFSGGVGYIDSQIGLNKYVVKNSNGVSQVCSLAQKSSDIADLNHIANGIMTIIVSPDGVNNEYVKKLQTRAYTMNGNVYPWQLSAPNNDLAQIVTPVLGPPGWQTGLMRWKRPTVDPTNVVTYNIGRGYWANDGGTNSSGQSGPISPTNRPGLTDLVGKDVVLVAPTLARNTTSALNLNGARSVTIIGGDFGTCPITLINISSFVFIEGVKMTLTTSHDALNASGGTLYYPDVYVQNCYFSGVIGGFTGNHSDIFQPQGNVNSANFHMLTADTNYQGMFVSPQNPINSLTMSYVNLKYNANTSSTGDTFTYLLWLRDTDDKPPPSGGLAGETTPVYPVNMYNVYTTPRPGQDVTNCVWPPNGKTNTPLGITYTTYVDGSGNLTYAANSNITGTIYKGPPPGGDFVVPTGTGPGLNYVSPGYSSSPL